MLTAEIALPAEVSGAVDAPASPSSLLAAALDTAATGMVIADACAAGFPIVYANAAFERLSGYSREEILGRDCLFLQGEQTDVAIREQLLTALRTRREFNGELVNYRKDGAPFWNQIQLRVLRDDSSTARHFVITQEDISERRRVRDRLRASEARLELAMSASELAMWDWNVATGEVYYNNQWQTLLEIPPEELLLRESLAARLVLPHDDATVFAELERHLAGELPHFEREYAIRTVSGRTKWVVARANVVQRDAQRRAERVIGVLIDVTARRESLRGVEEANKRWERAVAGTSDGLFDWDLETGYVWYAPHFREMLGYDDRKSDHEFPNTFATFQRAVHEADRIEVLARIRNHLEQRAPLELRCRLANKSGAYRWFRLRGNAERDAAGRPRRLSGSIRDIETQIGAEQAMRRSEEFYSTILNALPLTVAYVDSDERVLYANRACGALFGRDVERIRGQHMREVVAPELYAQLSAQVALAFRGRQIDSQIQTVDGQARQLDIDVSYLPHSDDQSNVQGCFVLARNVTARLRLEAELRQSQKMEAIGKLTGGVAHDFNNLLSVVIGNAQLLTRTLKESPRLYKQAETVLRAAMRGAELTRRLLSFARQQTAAPQVVQVNALLNGMYELLRRTLPGDVELRLELAERLHLAKLDPGQLENAVLNLVINARDAMPHGGSISIRSENATLGPTKSSEAPAPGEYSLITVGDTGAGMPPEIVERAFEPFFTTKESGKGSGLGLAMVYSFVKQAGGHVAIDSAPGTGTRVRMYFPRTFEALQQNDETAILMELPRGSESILVVDDNADVRTTAVEMLGSLGYRVFAAGAGPEALQMVAQHPEIALLFSDLMLPGGMSSVAMLRQLRLAHPHIKELFTSGFSDSVIAHRSLFDGSVDVMPKPYQLSDLARRVRAALDSVEEKARVKL
jgi:PAS domain S-box-containing protein